MRGSACLHTLLLAACTAVNPDYQGSEGEVGSASGDPPPDTTGAASEGMTSDSGAPMECAMHPRRPLQITVKESSLDDPDGVRWEPECPDGGGHIVELPVGNNAYPFGMGAILHSICDVPSCMCIPNTTVTIEFGDDIAFADDVELAGCTRVDLWTQLGPEGCEWGGVMLTAAGSALPSYIAANSLAVPPLAFIPGQPLTLGLEAETLCSDREPCDDARAPGRYALDVIGQVIVPVNDPPQAIEVAFLMGGTTETYIFDNRESSINRECEPQVSWTAQYRPPL